MKQPLAYIHPEAKIAENVIIDPFVTIEKNVEIGEGTWIGSNSVIMEGARIGKNCKIFPGAIISAIPQDLKFSGENTVAVIGDNTIVREFVTINRGTKASYKSVIGSNTLLMAYVHIAHDCVVGNNCILANNTTLAGHVEINDYANLGGLVAVHQFVKIGAHCYISGGSLVRKDVPPFVKAAREPLSYVGVNSIGLRRKNYSNEQIQQIQEIYRYLFLRKLNISQALDYIEKELPASKERDEILLFIRNSTRGIMRGYTSPKSNGEF
jgi:UDP-N-acetylglucosamine acyltransferase